MGLLPITVGLLLNLIAVPLTAAPATKSYRQHADLSNLLLSIENHESELRTMEAKFSTLETMLEDMQRQLHNNSKVVKESSSGAIQNERGKIASMELRLKENIAELAELKGQQEKQVKAFEAALKKQNNNIASLQTGLNTLIEAIRSGNAIEEDLQLYTVKPGDSLEKIANSHRSSVKVLKELNGLSGDMIFAGQKLKVASQTQ